MVSNYFFDKFFDKLEMLVFCTLVPYTKLPRTAVVAAHLEHLQLVPNLLKIFGTPSSVFVQLG